MARKMSAIGEASFEIPEQYLDCGKARRMLGWEPGFTLEKGLLMTIDWYCERLARRNEQRRPRN